MVLRLGIEATQVPVARASLPLPVILYLLAVVFPVVFNLGPIVMTLVRIVLLIMVLPMLVGLFAGRFGKLIPTDGLFLAHLIWMILALAVTTPAQVITQSGSVGVEFIGGYLMGRCYIRDRASFLALCRWLVLLVLVSLPFALHETMTGRPLIVETIRSIPGLTSVAVVYAEQRMGLERVQLVFAHPIHYGLFCSVVFSMCFVALKDVFSFPRRMISSFGIMLCGFLALSSGALLAVLLQIALIGWAATFARIRWRWWLLVGLFVLAYAVIDIFSNRSPIRVFMSYATFSAHNAYWRGIIFEWGVKNILGDAAENIPAAVWFGIGLNDWVRPVYMYSGSMDNFWLVTAIRYGVPGLIFLSLGMILVIFHVMRRRFDGDQALINIQRTWIFTMLGLSFTLTTVYVWSNIFSFVFFIFGAGVWLMTASPLKRSEDGATLGSNDTADPKALASPYTRFDKRNRRDVPHPA
ncbi:MAG: O-antigen ligase domain-containing protein [Pseudotabrizicola sp.]|uniref:O-antigen ligase family protein n=1 Tax=Pseudotabrizicola sp. TaxID=2939647 RepID=UPI00271A3118|nr:O-antigen ligase domain-containing protein [Pseudotabrizicola sp.]MDO9640846.1 O-antigen ligase domain-containing protein [Pseudotabrizicola sp.]